MIQSINLITIFILSICAISCQSKKEIRQPKEVISTHKDTLEATNMPKINEDNHSVVMDMVFGKPKHNIQNIGILVYDGVNELDFMGPTYVLGQIMGAKTILVSTEVETFKTGRGIEIKADAHIDDIQALDILVIPGGFKGTILAAYNEKILDWIRKIDQTTTYTTSVCTGGWILGATGLLQGKKATTNWYEAEKMLAGYGATFVKDRYVQDGKYWTSAGVTAGMDMSLAILHDLWGDRYTQGVMLDMEYDPAPPITGGSPEKTGFVAYRLMKSMYDAGIEPLIDSLEQQKLNNYEKL